MYMHVHATCTCYMHVSACYLQHELGEEDIVELLDGLGCHVESVLPPLHGKHERDHRVTLGHGAHTYLGWWGGQHSCNGSLYLGTILSTMSQNGAKFQLHSTLCEI